MAQPSKKHKLLPRENKVWRITLAAAARMTGWNYELVVGRAERTKQDQNTPTRLKLRPPLNNDNNNRRDVLAIKLVRISSVTVYCGIIIIIIN